MPQQKIEFIDFGKGFAILSICLYHYLSDFCHGSLLDFIQIGGTGVHLFIILSGFGLGLSSPCSSRIFYLRRFTKILIPYYVCITLIFLCNLIIPLYPTHGFKEYLSHIFAYKMFSETYTISFGEHFWYVSTIVQFYLIFPIIQYTTRKMNPQKIIVLGLFLSIAYWIGIIIFHKFTLRNYTSFFLQYIWEFLGGYAVSQIYKNNKTPVPLFTTWLYPLIAFVCFGLMSVLTSQEGSLGKVINDIPAAIGYIAVVATFFQLIPRSGFSIKKWFIFLGTISYEIYLLHNFIKQLVYYLLNTLFGISPHIVIPLFLALPLTVIISCFFHSYFIQLQTEPCFKVKKYLFLK